jgi:hypothetical protein
MAAKAVNFAGFQAAWFVRLRGAARGRPWLQPLCPPPVLGRILAFSGDRRAEIEVLASAAELGILSDTGRSEAGFFLVHRGVPGMRGGRPLTASDRQLTTEDTEIRRRAVPGTRKARIPCHRCIAQPDGRTDARNLPGGPLRRTSVVSVVSVVHNRTLTPRIRNSTHAPPSWPAVAATQTGPGILR